MSQREHIIEQAMQMFVAQGIKSVRMDDIAQQLGVSKRTLYELFEDKEKLLYLAMVCYFEQNRLRCEQMSIGAANVLEAMYMVLGDVMDRAEVTHRLMENLRKFYPALHRRLTEEGMEKNRKSFREVIKKGIAGGLFSETVNVDLAISVLYYTVSALVLRKELVIPEQMTEREAFMQIVSNFFRGVATAKGMELVNDYQRRYDPTQSKQQ